MAAPANIRFNISHVHAAAFLCRVNDEGLWGLSGFSGLGGSLLSLVTKMK